MAEPFAVYKSPNEQDREFKVDSTSKRYQTTNGQTTGPSAYVVQAGQVDVDKPSDPKKDENGDYTYLSKLRMGLTGLQDDINEFLTEQMEKAKNKKYKQDDEIRIKGEIEKLLDGGDDDDDDENE
ncbi:LAFE_0G03928g1_1 [Lachancea fermentati]|uniref:EKC/KEOPS complex subunit GON7 n=1 Tax=Lachancea fermentati TaxID=4955 RepID=A0A1G4MHA6_LACFM|nr:LAFE_0G03928g1_1 [Lachancea fermentati]